MDPPGQPCAGGPGVGLGGIGVGTEGVGAGVGIGGAGVGGAVAHRLGSEPWITFPSILRLETEKVEAPKLPSPPQLPGTQPVHCDEYNTAPRDVISPPTLPGPLMAWPSTCTVNESPLPSHSARTWTWELMPFTV